MSPASSFKIVTYEERVVPGTTPDAFHWFRKEEYEKFVKWERTVSLNQSGNDLSC